MLPSIEGQVEQAVTTMKRLKVSFLFLLLRMELDLEIQSQAAILLVSLMVLLLEGKMAIMMRADLMLVLGWEAGMEIWECSIACDGDLCSPSLELSLLSMMGLISGPAIVYPSLRKAVVSFFLPPSQMLPSVLLSKCYTQA